MTEGGLVRNVKEEGKSRDLHQIGTMNTVLKYHYEEQEAHTNFQSPCKVKNKNLIRKA